MLLSRIGIYASEKIAGDINFTLLKENKIKTLPNKYLNYVDIYLEDEQAAEFYENNEILLNSEENFDITNLDFYNALGVRLHIGPIYTSDSIIGPVELLLHRAQSGDTIITFEAFGPNKRLSSYSKNTSPYYYYALQTSGHQIEIRRYPIDLTNFSNEAGYIKEDVSNLVNYYKKSDTYSKTEVNNLIPEKYIEISLPSFISPDELYEGTITTEQLNQLKADSLIAIKVVIAEETVQYLLPHLVYENTENNFQAKYVQIGWDSRNEIFTNTIDINNTNFAYETRLNLIPFKISHLENDSGFIINTVDNLTNYYKKTETYTQEEINDLLNAITTLDIQVIDDKPENPSKTTIYLIGIGADGNNDYEEWLYTDSGWELIGTTEIDLTNYYTKQEVDTSLQNAINNIDVSKDWNENNQEATAYIQNRTHYVDGIEEIVTITYSFEADTGESTGGNPEAFERWSPNFIEDPQFLQNIEEGKVYNIIWDGQLYECVPHITGSRAYFGNLAIPMIGPDTGEPFCIVGRGAE